MQTPPLDRLQVGTRPLVVGTAATAETLASKGLLESPGCDIVEARLDRIGVTVDGWLDNTERLVHAGIPVLVTVRLVSQGGFWDGPDEGREPIFRKALAHASAVDIEVCSELRDVVCRGAAEHNKPVIVSYHNFRGTPPLKELVRIAAGIRRSPCAIPKIAAMVHSQSDIETLEKLLERDDGPICVIGMGDLGARTRVSFALRGSCFTYGYLDTSSAPGQLPSRELLARVRAVGED